MSLTDAKRDTNIDHLRSLVVFAEPTQCVIWDRGLNIHGYPAVWIKDRTARAHRVACEWTHGRPPTSRHHAAHSCGVRACVNPHHLRWATPASNIADKITHGTAQRGEANGRSKLTVEQVREIRTARKAGERGVDLAKRYGVLPTAINNIVQRHTWAWLDPEPHGVNAMTANEYTGCYLINGKREQMSEIQRVAD